MTSKKFLDGVINSNFFKMYFSKLIKLLLDPSNHSNTYLKKYTGFLRKKCLKKFWQNFPGSVVVIHI